MISTVLTRSWFYPFIRIALSVVLICSSVPTQAWGLLLGTGTAYAAAPEAHLPSSTASLAKQASQNALPAEPTNPLIGMNALGADRQPSRLLMDSDAAQAATRREQVVGENGDIHYEYASNPNH